MSQINDQLTPRAVGLGAPMNREDEQLSRYDGRYKKAGVEPPHKCTSKSADAIAQQLPGAPWKFAGNVDSVDGMQESEAEVTTSMGSKKIPYWFDNQLPDGGYNRGRMPMRIVLQCPYTGERWQWFRQLSEAVGSRGLGRIGVGLGDFASDIAADPQGFGGSWARIQTQLQAEGAGSTQVLAAQNALASAFDTLSSQMDASQALGAATQYVLNGQTIAGAIGTVQGLANAAKNGAPVAGLLESFTGVMIGTAATVGIVTAGVGAAIVGGVDLLAGILQQAGLFGGPPGNEICPGFFVGGSQPSYAITNGNACVAVYDSIANIVPGSSEWRHFPNQGDPTDLILWFLMPSASDTVNSFSWKNAKWSMPVDSLNPLRAIDMAFPNYRYLECEQQAYATLLTVGNRQAQWTQAFFAAWKLNAEYALNGLKPQDDASVLIHTARQWNRSHLPAGGGKDLVLTQASDSLSLPSICALGAVTPYASYFVQQALGLLSSSDPLVSNGGVVINMGDQPTIKALSTGGSDTTAGSAGSKIGYGIAAAAALVAAGIGIQAYRKHQSFGSVARSAYGKTIGRAGHSVGHALSKVKGRI